ncbi:hypothetical protein BSR28_01690 [Boudabousia liubingyangii]|uniref:asparagine synthetase B family protein n=1 Tax=Boudabousia liubingyangii TaxID=1921764 RepID=UPI00093D3B42|nr:asparagine synthetase B family protein [Boudabousia liubingyangii]OKL48440.1 hypothetical protein BSR28_01690 [Boudabousia liubingyangii]
MKLLHDFESFTEQQNHAGLFTRSLLDLELSPSFSVENDQDVLSLRSHFALVQLDETQVVLVADQMRSFPLYYVVDQDESVICVSDNWQFPVESLNLKIDPVGREQISEAGFCFSNRTAYQGLKQILPGQRVTISLADGGIKIDTLRVPFFQPVSQPEPTEEEFINQLSDAFDKVMERALSVQGDSQILVPLSGGLDSRLIATWLAKHQVKNVLCFTYGREGSGEMAISEKIAKTLGLEWMGITLTEAEVKKAWNQSETAKFLEYAFAGFSVPHVQDWFALRQLKEKGFAKSGDMVFPGHTIVDNFHNHEMRDQLPVPSAHLASVLAKKHAVFPAKVPTEQGQAQIREAVTQHLAFTNYDGSLRSLQKTVEGFNFMERQTKYINNSMRAYEYFGFRWAIPMLDVEFTKVWTEAPVDYTITRRLYGKWIQDFYAQVSHQETQLYQGAAGKLPVGLYRQLKKIGDLTGLTTAVNRYFAANATLTHPLGFDFYSQNSTKLQRWFKGLQGAPVHWHWVEEFVNDSWHPNLQIFTKK